MLEAPPRTTPVRAALLAAFVTGALVALQARVNGELRVALDSAVLAAVVSFTSGIAVLLVAVLSRPAGRAGLARVRDVPGWQRLGGLGGATLIASTAAAAPVVGVALLTLALVAGQTAGGMVVDRVGLGPGGPQPFTLPRVAGVVLCLVAVGLAAPGGGGEADPALLLLVLFAGVLVSVGSALNGRVNATTGDPAATTLLNFVVGITALLLVLGGTVLAGGLPDPDWPGPTHAWLYTGGLLGAVFVGVAAVVVRVLGVLRMSLAVVSGQVVGALLLDVVAPLTDRAVGLLTLLGAGLTLVAVAVAGRGAAR